jgi:hypothetical protein
MAINSQEIIQDIRAEFERLLDFVIGVEARTAKADSIERGLFKMLLRLGAQLLQLFGTVQKSPICGKNTFTICIRFAQPYVAMKCLLC